MSVVNGNLYDNNGFNIYTGNPKDYIGYDCIIKQAMKQPTRKVIAIKKIKEGLFCRLERYICGCKIFHGKFVGDRFIPKKCSKQYTRQPRLGLDFTCGI